MADHIIQAKCVNKAFDSRNAFNYIPGDLCEFNVSTGKVILNGTMTLSFDRQLFWNTSLGGRWSFEFDRANSSNTALRIFFCKDCGQPFDRLSEIGNHANQFHKPIKKIIAEAQEANSDEEEEQLLALRRAAEEAEERVKQSEVQS